MTPTYHKIWAKTNTNNSGEGNAIKSSARYHPLAYHLLDVAAVAHAMFHLRSKQLEKYATNLKIEPDKLQALALWLFALHDIGKASSGFQLQAKDLWCETSFGPHPKLPALNCRHDAMTAWYLAYDCDETINNLPVATSLKAMLPWSGQGINALIDAIAGHHGKPVQSWGWESNNKPIMPMRIGKSLISSARDLNADLINLFNVQPIENNSDEREQIAFAWWLATLLPFCDWVGSNTLFFKPEDKWQPLSDYWEKAFDTANHALNDLGLKPSAISKPNPAIILPAKATPSPVQEWAGKIDLPTEGPSLTIIEDSTGSGKTEAALILTHRLMAMGHACGFHIALPTMATADAMYRRLHQLYQNLFEGEFSSLSLAHAKSKFMTQPGDPSTASYCSGWIARESRRAFFAQAGAGTIDQAILAILASKYQTLRLCGLADKILIIDEAHAFDAYMSEEIASLLRFHAAQGGSAIILSATLPQTKRQALVTAFTGGARWPEVKIKSNAYPLATMVSKKGMTETPGATRRGTERRVKVLRLNTLEEAEAKAMQSAVAGAAVAIIRSTVDQAIETFNRLMTSTPENVEVQLFHARYLYGDRQTIEQDIVERFGKQSQPNERAGRILVATAVIEQSLDLDFDLLISDLAPVDLLIQRAGRLWRHKRERGYSNIEEPVFYIISPKPEDDAGKNWLDKTLPEPLWIYKDASLLWLSAKAIFDAGAIETATLEDSQQNKNHPRCLVEAVYGALEDQLSEELFDAQTDAMGQQLCERYIARAASLDPSIAYGREGQQAWADEGWVRTRLGDSVTLRLAKEAGGKLIPFQQSPQGDWSHAEVSLSSMRMRLSLKEPEASQRRHLTPAWHESDNAYLLVMNEEGEVPVADKENFFQYCKEQGFKFIENPN